MTTEGAQTPTGSEQKETGVTTQRSRTPRISDFFDEIDRRWTTFPLAPWRFLGDSTRQQFMPALEVYEKDDALHVNAELPGVQDKDISIEVTDSVLMIRGEKREERETREDNYYRSERSYGSFQRRVALPEGADPESVDATFKDGVLKITVPIREVASRTKKIEVKAG